MKNFMIYTPHQIFGLPTQVEGNGGICSMSGGKSMSAGLWLEGLKQRALWEM